MARITTHPGEVLREEFMVPMGLSANALALQLRVPANRIAAIIKEDRGVSPETALRLSRFFGTTPQFWINLQANHDLSRVSAGIGAQIEKEVAPYEAA